ncbi:MAG: LysM peptidoglycan-binding domain-containing protein [Gammaproteobacteria bacterium]|nr:LysM peptidoglycan-binding domain-containing protein [Gammaproteobacteria bacterium]
MMSSFLLPVQVSTDKKLAERNRVLPRPMFQRYAPYAPHALLVAIATIMAGCSSTPVQTNSHVIHGKKPNSVQKNKVIQDDLDLESADSMEELLQATDMDAVEGDRLAVLRYGNLWKRIPVGFRMNLDVDNPRISAQRNWFVSRQPYIDRLSARASRYIYYTVTEAERRGIPTELALLPVIESSYDPFASSNASAAGMWQFIPSTGRIYGLRQDQYYDGRRDVMESTRAAYDFLTGLYQQFGSWELALAAYNAGGGRVQQAINRNIAQGLPTDYWSLKLPQETMNYVPRFIAVAQIIKNPEMYGVQLPKIANRPHFRTVNMSGPVDLEQVVRATGLSSKEVLELNPAFLQGVTAPVAPFRILIPNTLSMSVDSKLKALPIVDSSRFGYTSGNGGYLAMNSQPITQTITQTITRSGGSDSTTSRAAAIMGSTGIGSNSGSTSTSNSGSIVQSVTVRSSQGIPTDSSALAAMANQAVVPSQAKIAKAVANIDSGVSSSASATSSVAAAVVQPIVATSTSTATKMSITTRPATTVLSSATNPNIASTTTPVTQSPIVVAPSQSSNITPVLAMTIDQKSPSNTVSALSPSEKSAVVSEIKSIAPANTVVTDPLDGKIPLTAIQTQQSVLDTQGQTKELSYEQPYLKSPTALDIKEHKLLPVETKIVADVKTPAKPKGVRTIYTVKAGDTLNSVATKTGLNWREIAKWNQMDANATLITGTPLYLYGAKKIVEVAPTTYVVQAGDTLTDVAAQFNLTTRQLADRNDLKVTSNLIKGARLNLVERDDSTASNSSKDKDSNSKADDKSNAQVNVPTDDYKIRRGDTLAKIASRYNLSVSDLAKLNGVPANLELQAGDTLSVPAAEKSTKRGKAEEQANDSNAKKIATKDYTVKSGETLARIAAKHGLTVVALADLNSIPSDTRIQAGDTITVPDVEKSAKKKGHR